MEVCEMRSAAVDGKQGKTEFRAGISQSLGKNQPFPGEFL
jgi:hypothetical protein